MSCGCEWRCEVHSYRVRFNGRLKNALGVTQDCDFVLHGVSEHDVRMRLYDKYEHIRDLSIVEVM